MYLERLLRTRSYCNLGAAVVRFGAAFASGPNPRYAVNEDGDEQRLQDFERVILDQ